MSGSAGTAPGRRMRRVRRVPPGAARERRGALRRWWPQYVAISPFYLFFAVFGLFPAVFSAYLAFHHWDGLNPVRFAGLQQFRFLIADDVLWHAVGNTLIIWVLSTVPMLLLSLVLAALLTAVGPRARLVYQVLLFVPSVTSIVAIAIFFYAIFNRQYGIVNAGLTAIGLPAVDWLSGAWTIKIVIVLLMTWQWVGYNAIIYFAGMQAIPANLYEAARIDGAGAVRMFFSITIPMLRPVILFTVIVSTINGLQSFAEPQVLFSSNASVNQSIGGPGGAGMTMVLYFYQQAFTNNNYGYAAAIAYVVLAVVAVFSFVNWRLVARFDR